MYAKRFVQRRGKRKKYMKKNTNEQKNMLFVCMMLVCRVLSRSQALIQNGLWKI